MQLQQPRRKKSLVYWLFKLIIQESNKPNQTRNYSYSALIVAIFIGICNATLLVITQNSAGYLFTNDHEVNVLVSELLLISSIFQILDSYNTVSRGIFEG
jgi:Na+-driven multidrug efflux pump